MFSLVIMAMFLSAFFDFDSSFVIGILFIMAMASFITSLATFLKEIFMASRYFKGLI